MGRGLIFRVCEMPITRYQHKGLGFSKAKPLGLF